MKDPIEVHVTELDWFFECGYRWSRQHVSGDWPETNSRPFMRGRAVHAAREHALLSWGGKVEGVEGGKWPTLEEMKEIGRQRVLLDMGGEMAPWDAELEDYFAEMPGGTCTLGSLEQEIEPYLRFDVEHVLPRYAAAELVAVEERWHIPIDAPDLTELYVLTGKLDLLARDPLSGRLVNHDLKTGARVTQEAADLSPQLSGYSAGIHHLYGEWPLHALGSPRFLKQCPSALKPGAIAEQLGEDLWGVYETVSTDRGPADVAAYLERLKVFLSMREAGWFPPAKGGFMSPCQRCPHAFEADSVMACKYTPGAAARRS